MLELVETDFVTHEKYARNPESTRNKSRQGYSAGPAAAGLAPEREETTGTLLFFCWTQFAIGHIWPGLVYIFRAGDRITARANLRYYGLRNSPAYNRG